MQLQKQKLQPTLNFLNFGKLDKLSFYGVLSFSVLFIFGLLSCQGHTHQHVGGVDDEHSSIFMQVLKEDTSVAFAIEAHRDALFLKGNDAKVSLQDFLRHLQQGIAFPQNQCQMQNPKATMREQGYHEIYLINVAFDCQKEVTQINFHFDEIYSSIKKVHANVLVNNNIVSHNIESGGELKL